MVARSRVAKIRTSLPEAEERGAVGVEIVARNSYEVFRGLDVDYSGVSTGLPTSTPPI